MKIEVNNDLNIIEIWLASNENFSKDDLKEYSAYKKYLPVIYRSGNADLFDNTSKLLKNNL